VFVGDLRAQAINLVVASKDAYQLRSKNLCAQNLRRLKIGGNMKITALNPLRAACAATEFARFPVDEQETVLNPNSRAWAKATATTRSLKLREGWQTASFFK